ncbi:helix-turn-helix domain-containing protein [Sneathiella limimaris]|uniref:helix-turn-helix domain-containing protein n=1 Tax=Sneathiella limimaris TaxID=1964213 RepID=UPI00146A922C|nr:helix-turn-helix domain-containing protein [Sneathiella limimaris]
MLRKPETNAIEELDVKSLLSLADYFEDQAKRLRNLASRKKLLLGQEEKIQAETIHRHKNLVLAGKMALELVLEGVQKQIACGRASTVFDLPMVVVEANFDAQYKAHKAETIQNRNSRILKLHMKGQSIRQIAEVSNCSRSTVHYVINKQNF